MKYNALHDAGRFSKLRRNRKRWQKVVSVMASIVVFCTTYALILPAITAESQDLSNVQLICNQAEHSHGAECSVIERGELICQIPTEPAHTHGDACYAVEVVTETSTVEVLTCTSEEEGHQHDSSCYTAEERTTEKEVSKLICTEDTSAHEHGDSCYAQIVKQICTLEEHIHGAGCYEAKDEIKLPEQPQQPAEPEQPVEPEAPVEPEQPVEGQEPEVPVEPEHVHDETCIQAEDGTWSCEAPVVEPEQPVEPEVPAHQHEDACYDENGQLICEIAAEEEVQPEIPVLPEVEEPEIDEDVICEMYEHEHYELCYDANGEVICPLYEHEHDETCYPEEELFVALPEGAQVPETHSETYMKAAEADEEGNIPYSVAVYTEPGTLPEGARLAVELLEDEAYTAAGEQLAEQGITPSGYIAFDIHFEAPSHVHSQDLCYDEEGNLDCAEEIVWEEYPIDSTVYVSINAKNMLPEGIDEQSVQVHHHAETDMNILDKAVALFTGEPEVVIETVVDQLLNMEAEIAPEMNLIETFVSELDETMLDVNAAFEVNGFSTFTVTWENAGEDVVLYFINQSTYEIFADTQSISTTLSSALDLKNTSTNAIINSVEAEYQYVEARLGEPDGIVIDSIYFADGNWYYTVGTSTEVWEVDTQRAVYLVYNVENGYMPTVDTKSLGVEINLINLDGSEVNKNKNYDLQFTGDGATADLHVVSSMWGGNSNSTDNINTYVGNMGNRDANSVRNGIVKNELSAAGYPELADEFGGDELSYIFEPVNDNAIYKVAYSGLNHLFYPTEDGFFEYNSADYFAKLNTDNNTFTVYNQEGAGPGSPRAMFMPFDNLTDEHDMDYHFAMTMETDFYIPKNGQVNGKDMIFEFDGDDDVWVFIDGVLVLDIGGIHQEAKGTINFADGKVDHPATYNGNTESIDTTLEKIFRAVKGDKWVGENMHQDAKGNWLFNDFSEHTLKFFYIERGAGGSNCQIKFNLPTIPKNSLVIRKDIEGVTVNNTENENGEAEKELMPVALAEYLKNLTFDFRVVEKVSDNQFDVYDQVVGKIYVIMDENGNEVGKGIVGADGIVTIKPGQMVAIQDITQADSNDTFYVEELIKESYNGQYYGVEYNISAGGGQNGVIENTEENTGNVVVNGQNFVGYKSNILYAADSNSVAYTNLVDYAKMVAFTVEKQVEHGSPARQNAEYTMEVEIGGMPVTVGSIYKLFDEKGVELRNPNDTNGDFKVEVEGEVGLKNGQRAVFVVTAGSTFEVTEKNVPTEEDFLGVTYETIVTENNVEGEPITGSSGLIESTTKSYKVLVTNEFEVYATDITLAKKVTINGVEIGTDNTIYGTEFEFLLTLAAENAGEYQVEYVTSVEGDNANKHKNAAITFTVAEGDDVATAIIKLYHGETATIKELPIDASLVVAEQNTDGYSVNWTGVNGTTTKTGNAEQTIKVAEGAGAVCINTTGYALPSTGGIGTTLYTMSGMAMMSAALVGGYGLRRKRERGSEE